MSLLFDPTTGELVEEDVVKNLPDKRKKKLLSLQNPKPKEEITKISGIGAEAISKTNNPIINHPFKIGIITLVFILGIILIFHLTSDNTISSYSEYKLNINDLTGYYSAEQILGNNSKRASAQIINVNGNLTLRLAIPNYPPQDIPVTIDLNNLKMETAHLGMGDIIFHRETNEIEIILKRESNIWILRK